MFQTILCATGGSASGDRALAFAVRLTDSYDASLRIVHVVEKLPGGFNWHGDEDWAIVRLKARTAALRRHGFDASLHVIRAGTGHVAELLADTAAAVSADVVIVGTGGRSPVCEATMGSVAQRLLGVARCPVLAVPPASERRDVASAYSLTGNAAT
jgi:nucleotide-binding universal stress UspA family protein